MGDMAILIASMALVIRTIPMAVVSYEAVRAHG